MIRSHHLKRFRELLEPQSFVDWMARLVVFCGGTSLSYALVKSALGLPVDLALDFIVVFLATAPVFLLTLAVSRWKDQDLSAMTKIAMTDGLTNLMNRRAFEAAITEAGDGAVMIIDIDHFKYVNDRYGHSAGDEVLRAMSGHLRRNVRTGDIVARIGGEEFAIYLPDCDSFEVDLIGDRLCRGFVVFNERVPVPIKVTMSVGAAFSLMSSNNAELIQNADQALYHAKRSGRARLAFWQPPPNSRI